MGFKINNKFTNLLAILWCLLLLATVCVGFAKWNGQRLQTNMLDSLPQYQDKKTLELVNSVSDKINSQLIIVISSNNKNSAKKSIDIITQQLTDSRLFNSVKNGIDLTQASEIYNNLSKYRYQLLSLPDYLIAQNKDFQRLENNATKSLYQLQSTSAQQFFADPLFLFQNYLTNLTQSATQLQLDNKYFYVYQDQTNTNDISANEINSAKKYNSDKPTNVATNAAQQTLAHNYFIFATLKQSSYALNYQQQVGQLLDNIDKKFTDSDEKVYMLATLRYAEQATNSAKTQMSLISIGSFLGIFALFIMIFKSPKTLIYCLISMAISIVIAFITTFLIFGQLHIFSLIFGTTIIGVAVDYYLHFYISKTKSNITKTDNNAIDNINYKSKNKSISLPLALSFSSTALSFLGFYFANINMLSQVAVFSIIALLVSYINIILIFPLIFKNIELDTHPILERASHYLITILRPIRRVFNYKIVYFLLIMSFLTVLLLIKPNDDIHAMQELSPQLKQQEHIIKNLLKLPNYNQYIVIFAKSFDKLLNSEQKFQLAMQKNNNTLFSKQKSLSDIFPTLKQQQLNYQAYQNIYQSKDFGVYLQSLGIAENKIKPITNFTAINYTELFNKNDLANTIFNRVLYLKKIEQYALVIPVPTTIANDDKIITNYVATNKNNMLFINQSHDISMLLKNYRVHINYVILLACGFIITLLSGFFGFKKASNIVAIPSLAILLSALFVYYLGFNISIFNSLAALLLLGMGIDYMVFLTESDDINVSAQALILACITTLLSFTLLSISNIAVIASFASMVTIGIILILTLSLVVNSNE